MRKYFASALAVGAVVPGVASAALPEEVTTALTTAATDAATLWTALVVVAVVGLGFKLGILGVKKAPGMVK